MRLIWPLLLLAVTISPVGQADTIVEKKTASAPGADYRIGPEDSLAVRVMDVDENQDRPIRVDPNGYIDLPLIGRIQAAGLTVTQLKEAIAERYSRFIKQPYVSVNIAEYHSQPVSVLGAVNQPAVHQLQGPKRLLEVLAMAGGPRPDAGGKLRIMRQKTIGTLDVPGAHDDESGQFSVADLDLDRLLNTKSPAENILVRPHDVVTVSRSELVYVMGEVKKAGGFTLHEKESMSLMKALAMAEGLQRTAAPKHAKILRASGDGNRQEIPIDLSKILDGRAPDMSMRPDDVLFVPNNLPRSVAARAAETALQIGTGVLIFRR